MRAWGLSTICAGVVAALLVLATGSSYADGEAPPVGKNLELQFSAGYSQVAFLCVALPDVSTATDPYVSEMHLKPACRLTSEQYAAGVKALKTLQTADVAKRAAVAKRLKKTTRELENLERSRDELRKDGNADSSAVKEANVRVKEARLKFNNARTTLDALDEQTKNADRQRTVDESIAAIVKAVPSLAELTNGMDATSKEALVEQVFGAWKSATFAYSGGDWRFDFVPIARGRNGVGADAAQGPTNPARDIPAFLSALSTPDSPLSLTCAHVEKSKDTSWFLGLTGWVKKDKGIVVLTPIADKVVSGEPAAWRLYYDSGRPGKAGLMVEVAYEGATDSFYRRLGKSAPRPVWGVTGGYRVGGDDERDILLGITRNFGGNLCLSLGSAFGSGESPSLLLGFTLDVSSLAGGVVKSVSGKEEQESQPSQTDR